MRIVLSFPFPQGCDTVSGAQLLVDGKPDDEHTTYRITGIRWVNWFKPRQVKRISVGYKAWGQGNYRYVLDRVNLTRRLRFLMRIEGIARGHQVDFPPDALPPVRAPSDIPGCWDYLWDYSRLVSNRDIAVNFPTRESPSVAAWHVMRTVGNYLFVARLAPIFLAVFAGALMWGGPLNRGRAPK